MSTCAKCIYKPFCKSSGYVCSSFKDRDRFADRDEVIREFAERLILVEETTAINCATNEKVVRVADIDTLVKEMTEKHDR